MSEMNRTDIITVDMTKPLHRESYGVLLAAGDALANRFGAILTNKGVKVDVSGYTVTGAFIRPDGETIHVTGGVDGNTVYVDLPAVCYNTVEGAFSLALKLVSDGFTRTVRLIEGYIRQTDTGSYVATDEMIITLDNMKGLAAEMATTHEEAKNLINELDNAADEVEQAVEEANHVAEKLPYIGSNENWYMWDDEAGEFVDSGSPSRGEQGLPGETGERGPEGPPGPAGSDGKDGTGVTILGSYDSEDALKAAHPTGNAGDSYLIDGYLYVWSVSESTWKNVGQIQGPQGKAGADGYTPVKGVDYFDGEDGADGYTPVRGTDYWTAADQQSMVNDVIAALPVYNGEVAAV